MPHTSRSMWMRREVGDDIWFELVDGDSNQTFTNSDFGTNFHCQNIQLPRNCVSTSTNHLPVPQLAEPCSCSLLEQYASQYPQRTIDQTILFGVDWNSTRNGPIDNPSWWKSDQRLVRDNHYAEALENLGKRAFPHPPTLFNRWVPPRATAMILSLLSLRGVMRHGNPSF